jgi:octaprenyl-diphosphate synthase
MQYAPRTGTPIERISSTAARSDGAGYAEQSLCELTQLLEHDLAQVEQRLSAGESNTSVCATAAADLVRAGGKRLRPALSLLAFRISSGGGPCPGPVLELATAVELLHTASLLHDDVIDEGTMRRGKPCARIAWGNAVSVVAGDLLLVQALDRVHKIGNGRLDELMVRTLNLLVDGEVQQLECRGRLDTDRDTFEQIANRKTGALFVMAMVGSALIAQSESSLITALQEYAAAASLAFQLGDDVLDLCASPEALGKTVGKDLACGAATLPIADVVQADPRLRAALEGHVQSQKGEALPEWLCSALIDRAKQPGTLARSEALVAEYAGSATSSLSKLPQCSERDALEQLAALFIARALAPR